MSSKDGPIGEKPNWEILNAFLDGELSPSQEAWVESCAKKDLDIASEIARLKLLKNALAGSALISSDEQTSATEERKTTGYKQIAGGVSALAAVIVLFVMLFPLGYFSSPDFDYWALDRHEDLSGQSFVVSELEYKPLIAAAVSGTIQAPDLTGSKLYLVDLSISTFDRDDAIVMHYRGLRGCRVSLLATPLQNGQKLHNSEIEEGFSDRVGAKNLVSDFWNGERFRFALLATGMEQKRFDSIATYLKLEGERNLPSSNDEVQYAMQQVYAQSTPCA
ncbi:hypothetical protein WH96_03835 [Kiloniella spongiae]|uniref:Zinc-finger domain-containing protein n=1 Tax=Kiloniella spongiae TaxID=1489064 RepID=A0A0H2N122_9PROT|nr:hypothetical protein [Kiloniella spongiae]KLN62605.1 hypothetical protein WH96_03835 [Kiloniella spongiae]